MSEITASPLCWPAGWRRAQNRRSANFKRYGSSLSIADGVERVQGELDMLRIPSGGVVISSNVRPTLAGVPSSRGGVPLDPGVAVYWLTRQGKSRCIATDRYDSVAGNLGAIAATLEAMRAIDRHGGAEILDRAFTGFTALPAPEQWFQVLAVGSNATRAEIETAHSRLAMKHHPDRGGDTSTMARINTARDEGLRQALA